MKILIAGDFFPRGRVKNQIKNRMYSEIFPNNIIDILKSVDYSLVNFECSIVEDDCKPIAKCGPHLKCSHKGVEVLKYAGFSAVTMANNHILDFGEKGLNKTIECCKKNGIDIVGVGNNLEEAKKILYVEKKGEKLAIINCCEHEFSIASYTTAGANPLNPISQYYSIKEAKNNADYVVVIVHGGHEHYQLPSPRMQDTYRFFIDAGADAVVNHHQHCYSGYEIYRDKPIFYGLGNFIFDDAQTEKWTEGYMVELLFGNKIEFKKYPYIQYAEKPTIELLKEDSFDEKIEQLNDIISNHDLLKKMSDEYYSKSNVSFFLEPIRNRWILAAQNRGLLPSFVTKKWILSLLSIVRCESHRDKLLYYLHKKLSEIE